MTEKRCGERSKWRYSILGSLMRTDVMEIKVWVDTCCRGYVNGKVLTVREVTGGYTGMPRVL